MIWIIAILFAVGSAWGFYNQDFVTALIPLVAAILTTAAGLKTYGTGASK